MPFASLLRLIVWLACLAFGSAVHADEAQRLRILKTASAGLTAHFGQRTGNYSVPGTPIAAQLGDMLGGPPEQLLHLHDEVYLYAACRLHSCDEKGAVIVDLAQGRLLTGSWRHFHCRRGACARTPVFERIRFAGLRAVHERAALARYAALLDAWEASHRH